MRKGPLARSVCPAVAALWCGLLVAAGWTATADEVCLVGEDLSSWRGDTGQWVIVGGAKMDPEDPRRLATVGGTGVLVNGPTGRTCNLLSKLEHGDVEVHVEFMVPQGSNSGVYFQGRYEIQILDSLGGQGAEIR